jgi:predicted RNA-binding Zn ribbon-like protein
VTGQEHFDSYEHSGVVIAVDLVNGLAVAQAFGRPAPSPEPLEVAHRVLEIDPPTAALLREEDVPGMVALARRLRVVFDHLDQDDLDSAAHQLNDLLAAHPAHPHLAYDGGRWRLHHHPADAALVPMVTAICAEGMARMISAGDHDRFGTCASEGCDRVFLDGSKNASRRFCSTTCQNRVKAAAFRRRHTPAQTHA